MWRCLIVYWSAIEMLHSSIACDNDNPLDSASLIGLRPIGRIV